MTKKSSKRQVTRRQHWLPRASYLSNFINKDGKVTAYMFGEGDRADFLKTSEVKHIKPENVGLMKNLYETSALPPNTIENVLSGIEAAYGRVLEDKIKQHKMLTEREHEIVARSVSTLENRTPMQQKHVNNFLDRLNQTGQSLSMAHGAPEAAKEWATKIEKTKESMFAQWMAITIEVNKWSPLDFCFLSPASYVSEKFIGSDHPVTLVDMTGDNSFVGLNQWHETAECVAVLTPDIAIFGNTRGITGYKEVDYNFLREINNRILRRADKMLITAEPIGDNEAEAIVRRMPQSLLLNYLKLPDKGRSGRIIRSQKRKERVVALRHKIVSTRQGLFRRLRPRRKSRDQLV